MKTEQFPLEQSVSYQRNGGGGDLKKSLESNENESTTYTSTFGIWQRQC
jgi:hypothetical protein